MGTIIGGQFNMPAYLRGARCHSFEALEGVSVDVEVETEDEFDVYKRTFHTPAGKLTDKLAMCRPRSKYGLAPSSAQREHLGKCPEDVDKLPYLLANPEKASAPKWNEINKAIGDRGILHIHAPPGAAPAVMPFLMGMENAMIGFYHDRDMFERLFIFSRATFTSSRKGKYSVNA